ncbi:MAG: retroviral-like aspartic protease family protein [Treponema sp.]|jgi:clan AA aspartic protease|nr:retroviral-like aspartic protease family protein [Treponema sp.]
MGEVTAMITLVNTGDVAMVQRGLMKEAEVRQAAVTAVVDTGSTFIVINEALRAQLGLQIRRSGSVGLAGGKRSVCTYTEPVTIRWKDRETVSYAVVLPEGKEILLGVIPLEGMDLMVNPSAQCLEGAHGDEMVFMLR